MPFLKNINNFLTLHNGTKKGLNDCRTGPRLLRTQFLLPHRPNMADKVGYVPPPPRVSENRPISEYFEIKKYARKKNYK